MMLPPKVNRSTIAAQSLGSVKVLIQPPVLHWYAAHGFTETEHYLHVRAWGEEPARTVRPGTGYAVVGVFLHADAANEQRLRDEFTRVYRCHTFDATCDTTCTRQGLRWPYRPPSHTAIRHQRHSVR
jgi:hypothetical protein